MERESSTETALQTHLRRSDVITGLLPKAIILLNKLVVLPALRPYFMWLK